MSQFTPQSPLPSVAPARVAVVAAEWNAHITGPLAEGAAGVLQAAGVEYDLLSVPGTVELTYAASRLMNLGKYDAIIIIGVVIRGDTPHFDYVCESVTAGMTRLNLRGEIPVIFGVLTVDSEQQALDRAGGAVGNKGAEAAEAAIKMIHFSHTNTISR